VRAAQIGENEVGLAPHRTSMVWAWIVWVLGGISLAVALWLTVGPWAVIVRGESYGCGSPFMGRYRSVPDPVATAAVACHLQAANRLHIAEAEWIVGIAFVLIGIVLLLRRRWHSEPGSTVTLRTRVQ
jgi:hypothetical protein